jgi:hypothetical protein
MRKEAVSRGDVVAVDSDDKNLMPGSDVTWGEIVKLCQMLEAACLQRGELVNGDLVFGTIAIFFSFSDIEEIHEVVEEKVDNAGCEEKNKRRAAQYY